MPTLQDLRSGVERWCRANVSHTCVCVKWDSRRKLPLANPVSRKNHCIYNPAKNCSNSPSLQNKDPGGGVGSTSRGWRWVSLGVGKGGFKGWGWVGLGIRGWRWVGLGICKVGGVGSGSNLAPWILCSTVRTISISRTPHSATSANPTLWENLTTI